MKKSRFSAVQITKILKEFEGGKTAEEISREHGVSKATLYKWRKQYGGMEASWIFRIMLTPIPPQHIRLDLV